jgi:hypothetical protein
MFLRLHELFQFAFLCFFVSGYKILHKIQINQQAPVIGFTFTGSVFVPVT